MNLLTNEVDVSVATQAQTVLLKDSGTSPASAPINFSFKLLEAMEASRITWEQGAYKVSNQGLYSVLARCLSYCGEMDLADAKKRSAALEAFFKERNYKYKRELPLANRVVRAVFGEIDRRRISTYALVIRQAQKEDVAYANFPAWVESRGGIQEITLTRSATYVSAKQKAEIAMQIAESKDFLGFAKSDLLSQVADPNFMGEACVLIAEQQADGSFGVRAVLRQDGLIKTAYAYLYADQRETQARIEAEVKAANDADGAIAKSA